MEKIKIALPIIFVIVYSICMLKGAQKLKLNTLFSVSKIEFVNFQFNYQFLLLLITIVSLTGTYFLNKGNFMSYFRFGGISSPATVMKLFGIKENDSWLKTGISLTIFISLATTTFMYFQLKSSPVNWSILKTGIFWIVLFSLTNSFGEEIIFRMGIVSPLTGLLQPITIFIISGVLFGIPHLVGMPSGFIGATMAGILGLVLAKSLFETNGFFWAWIIHFLQDVIIIGSLYVMSISK